MILRRMGCCAIKEICDLSISGDAETAMQQVSAKLHVNNLRFRAAFVIFSQANGGYNRGAYGEEFAAYIKSRRLGRVVKTQPATNPNTYRKVIVWTWTINPDNLRKWMRRNNV